MTDPTVRLIADLAARGLTIAVAESLTGGQLTAELTRPAGASAVVLGGIVVYATELKHTMVGVDQGLLERHGPVHPEVAGQLARGIRTRLAVAGRAADIGIATTGVAGPDPQGGRDPGTVFVGLAMGERLRVLSFALQGDRSTIRSRVVQECIAALTALTGTEAAAE